MKTGAQIVLGIVAGITIVATADNIRKILKDQADLKKQLKSLEKESLYKDIQIEFQRKKRGLDMLPNRDARELELKGFEFAEDTIEKVFDYPEMKAKRPRMIDFYRPGFSMFSKSQKEPIKSEDQE